MDRPWTANDVEARLIQAFTGMQGRAFYSCQKGVLRQLGGKRISGLELIACTAEILGRDSELRKILLAWARAKAAGAYSGELSFAAQVRLHPSWGCERTAHTKRRLAAEKVANAIITEQRVLQPRLLTSATPGLDHHANH